MKRVYLLLLLQFGLTASSMAAGNNLPQITEHYLSLSSHSQIASEIAVGQVMEFVGADFNGLIRLTWSDAAFTPTAQILRNQLMSKGIPLERVVLKMDRGGFRPRTANGIEIQIESIRLRLPECNYASQDWHFSSAIDAGCALNNTLSSSLINPEKYFF
ncbi:hypothetical protein AAGR22_01315 [Erwinia sp. HDF1-3R]|uniref:hypothetical protein n=1 Tax=Erwinia sp. HDF1-3R TaxID=3141543 RepID=UPI0031F54EBC